MDRWGSRSAQTWARARGVDGNGDADVKGGSGEWGFALEFESVVDRGLAGHVCTWETWGDAGYGGDDRCDGRRAVECEKGRRRRRTRTKKAKTRR